jgi:hypothetical protein
MLFSPEDATRYKKGLSSNEAKERWASIASKILSETGDEGKAIRVANSRSQGSSPINRDSVSRRLNRLGHP